MTIYTTNFNNKLAALIGGVGNSNPEKIIVKDSYDLDLDASVAGVGENISILSNHFNYSGVMIVGGLITVNCADYPETAIIIDTDSQVAWNTSTIIQYNITFGS